MIQNVLKTSVWIIAFLLGSIMIGFLLLVVVYLLPQKTMIINIQDSVAIFAQEKNVRLFPMAVEPYGTDAIMLETAAYDGNESIFHKVLLSFRYGYYDSNGKVQEDEDSIIDIYSEHRKTMNKVDTISYARYWHGYLLYVKPLLFFFNYYQIRIINAVLQFLLTITLVILLWKYNLRNAIFPYLLILGILWPPLTVMFLNYSDIYYIFSIASIILIVHFKKWAGTTKYLYFFLILGVVTSYFDLLSYPVATLGIPLVFYFLMKRSAYESPKWKDDLIEIIAFSVIWSIGYSFMWLGKWILASLLTDHNVIADAYHSVLVRTSKMAGESSFSILFMLLKTAGAFVLNPITIIALFYTLYRIIRIIHENKLNSKYLATFASISSLPFFWFVIASNHSYIHTYYSSRDLIITAFAGMCIFADYN